MTVSISGSTSTPQAALPIPAEPAPAQSAPKTDTVKLSQAAQVQLLVQQGESVSQIATSLSISPAIVDGYLDIPVAPPASAPTSGTQTNQGTSTTPVAALTS